MCSICSPFTSIHLLILRVKFCMTVFKTGPLIAFIFSRMSFSVFTLLIKVFDSTNILKLLHHLEYGGLGWASSLPNTFKKFCCVFANQLVSKYF